MATLALTLLGDDRAGLVSSVSSVLQEHGAGWERSRMSRLSGKFAGILEVVVPDAKEQALVAALEQLAGPDLHLAVERTDQPEHRPVTRFSLDLLGADRPGIVAEISALLADREVNVEELLTTVREAPMAGGLLFEAHAVLSAPADAGAAGLREALEALADELMVDVALLEDQRAS